MVSVAIPAALVFQPLLAPVRHEVRRMAGYRTPIRFSLTLPRWLQPSHPN